MMKSVSMSKIKAFLSSPFFLFFVIELVVLLLWLMAFFPGTMSFDSVDQWLQSSAMRLSDWHSYLHTLFIAFLRLFWDSPAIVALVQIVATAGLFAWMFSYLFKKAKSPFLVVLFFALFVLSIPVGIYSVTLWKDVPFSLGLIGLSFFLTYQFLEKKSWNTLSVVTLLMISMVVIGFRHNGIIYIFFTPFIVWLFFRTDKIKWLYPALLLPLVLVWHFLLPNLLHVTPKPTWLGNLFIYQSTANFYIHQPQAKLTDATLEALRTVLPLEEIKEKFNPAHINPIFFHRDLNQEVFASDKFQQTLVQEFWQHNLWNNFGLFLRERTVMFLRSLSGQWLTQYSYIVSHKNFNTDIDFAFPGFRSPPVTSENFDLRTEPVLPALNIFLRQTFADINAVDRIDSFVLLRVIVWSAWLGLLTLIILFIASLYSKKTYFLLFASNILIQAPILFLVNVAAEWRYVYFFYLSFFVAIPLYFIKESEEPLRKGNKLKRTTKN